MHTNSLEFAAVGNRQQLDEFQKISLKGPFLAKIMDKEFIIKSPEKIFSNFDILSSI